MNAIVEIASMPTDTPHAKVWATRHEIIVGKTCEAAFKNVDSEDTSLLAQAILQIRGVESVQLYPYNVVVTKAMLFSWNEIDDQIERLLKEHVISIAVLVDG